jgi:hypothetical protein
MSLMQRIEALEAQVQPPEPDPTPVPGDKVITISDPAALPAPDAWKPGYTYLLDSMKTGAIVCNVDDVTIKALPGARVVSQAFRKLATASRLESGVTIMPYTSDLLHPDLHRHPATQEGPWDGHRDRMRPEQFIANGKLLEAVYSRGDLRSGTFYVEGDTKTPEAVFLMAHEGPVQSVGYAYHPCLLYGSGKNVTVEGIEFLGAASTGKRGAILTNDGWQLRNVACRYSAGPGFEITGKDVIVEDCLGEMNGQLNYLIRQYTDLYFIGCTSRHGNRKGFNAAWEAGGTKIVNEWGEGKGGVNITIRDYTSEHDNGPGLWFDINNRGADIDGVLVRDALAAGVMFEFGFYDGKATNIRVEGVRPYPVPEKFYSRQDGIVWQASVHNSTFDTMHVEGCNKAYVFKVHERRGASLNNRLTAMTAANVREPWYMEEFNAQRIHEAIASGANPKGYYGWMNHGNHIEQVKPI